MNGEKSTSKRRGIYERVPGSGVWWIQYTDAQGRRRREKAGLYSSAEKLLDKRHTETLQGKKLPETLRAKPVTFGELLDDALEYSKTENGARTTTEIRIKYDILRPVFGTRPAEDIEKQEIRRWLVARAAQENWKRATMMRWHAAISLAYSQGMANNRIGEEPGCANVQEAQGGRGQRAHAVSFRRRRTGDPCEAGKNSTRNVSRHSCSKSPAQQGCAPGSNSHCGGSEVQWQGRKLHLPKTKNGTARDIDLNAIALGALESPNGGPVTRPGFMETTKPTPLRGIGTGSRRWWKEQCRGLHLALQPAHLCQ